MKAQAGGRQEDFVTNSFAVWGCYRMSKLTFDISPGAAYVENFFFFFLVFCIFKKFLNFVLRYSLLTVFRVVIVSGEQLR